MDDLYLLFVKLISPLFYPFVSNQRIFLLYLGSALILAFFVYLASKAWKRAGLVKGFFAYCFPKAVYTHRSAIVDYKYFLINKATYGIFFGPLVISSTLVSDLSLGGLQSLSGQEGLGLASGPGAGLAFTALGLLVLDLAIFVAHYLQHKVPLLWEFHKVHHSAEVMTPMTVYRMHPVDDLLAGSLSGALGGLLHGVFAFLYADGVGQITVLQLNLFTFLFYLGGYNLRHSHIWLSYPRLLSHLLISPAQHQIHHSSHPRHYDKNIGFIFAFWDYFARTLYVPDGKEEIAYGLEGDEHKAFDSVWNLYVLPFKNAAARFRNALKSGA